MKRKNKTGKGKKVDVDNNEERRNIDIKAEKYRMKPRQKK